MPYCSWLQSVIVYNFTEMEITCPGPLWDYVADCLWLRGLVSICLMRRTKYDWFIHEELLLDWLFFLLFSSIFSSIISSISSISATICLLFKIFCRDNNFFILESISPFSTSVCPEGSQNSYYCITVMQSNFNAI